MKEINDFDWGYGLIGNISTKLLLDGLNPEAEKKHREYLQRDDPARYEQYLLYEEQLDKLL